MKYIITESQFKLLHDQHPFAGSDGTIYLGSCVEVGDDNSCNYINDIFSDATEMAYYVGNPDDEDFGQSEEISREEFLKNIDISVVKTKKLKGDVGFYYIPNLKMYYIYNFDDGIHYFYK